MDYTNKIVDGKLVPLTADEIAAFQARDAAYTPPIPDISPSQARIALTAAGLRAQVEAAINIASSDIQDYWHYAGIYQRHHPVIVQMAGVLGLSDAQVDALFIAASLIT